MALSSKDISTMVVGLYGVTPGADLTGQLIGLNWTQQEFGLALAQNPLFQTAAFYPLSLTNDQFSTRLLDRLMGNEATAENKSALADAITALQDAGVMTREALAVRLVELLDLVSESTDAVVVAAWGNAGKAFDNKVTVSLQQATSQNEVNTTILDGVSSDPASVQAALATLTGGSGGAFTLTVNQDNFTGASADDTFNAQASQDGAGNLINTLQNVDVLDGGNGIDVLNATLAEFFALVAPTLKNIEAINVRFATTGAILDLANTTGATVLTVAESTNSGQIEGVGDIATLAVKNQNRNVSFDGSTASTLALTLDNFGTAAGGNRTLDLGYLTAAPKATTLNVSANHAYVNVDSSFNDTASTLTIVATGASNLSFVDSGATLKSVTVTGPGSVDLSGTAFTGALTSFDASANTGGVVAAVQSTQIATVRSGSGKDVIDMDTKVVAGSSVDLGAGDDAIYVGALLGQFKSIAGGAGTDIINITSGATWTAGNAARISGFETLDVSGGTGAYDLSLGSFSTVQIDQAVNGPLAGKVTFSEVADSSTLNVIAAAKSGADFTTGADITLTLKDATGTTAAGTAESTTLNVTTNDGNNDGVAQGNVIITKHVADGVENVTIDSVAGLIDTGIKGGASAYSTTLTSSYDSIETLTLTGTTDIVFTALTNKGNTLTKVDASGSSGDITLDGSAITSQIAYIGSSGVDTFTASAGGGSIHAGGGNDVINLVAGAAKADTLIYKAAGDVSFKDADADGKIDGGLGSTESITGFVTAAAAGGSEPDLLDFTTFAFSGSAKSAVNKGAIAQATFAAKITDFFADAADDRGVAFGTDAGDTYVFVDVNKDGDWNIANDLAIKLVGVTNFGISDIAFG